MNNNIKKTKDIKKSLKTFLMVFFGVASFSSTTLINQNTNSTLSNNYQLTNSLQKDISLDESVNNNINNKDTNFFIEDDNFIYYFYGQTQQDIFTEKQNIIKMLDSYIKDILKTKVMCSNDDMLSDLEINKAMIFASLDLERKIKEWNTQYTYFQIGLNENKDLWYNRETNSVELTYILKNLLNINPTKISIEIENQNTLGGSTAIGYKKPKDNSNISYLISIKKDIAYSIELTRNDFVDDKTNWYTRRINWLKSDEFKTHFEEYTKEIQYDKPLEEVLYDIYKFQKDNASNLPTEVIDNIFSTNVEWKNAKSMLNVNELDETILFGAKFIDPFIMGGESEKIITVLDDKVGAFTNNSRGIVNSLRISGIHVNPNQNSITDDNYIEIEIWGKNSVNELDQPAVKLNTVRWYININKTLKEYTESKIDFNLMYGAIFNTYQNKDENNINIFKQIKPDTNLSINQLKSIYDIKEIDNNQHTISINNNNNTITYTLKDSYYSVELSNFKFTKKDTTTTTNQTTINYFSNYLLNYDYKIINSTNLSSDFYNDIVNLKNDNFDDTSTRLNIVDTKIVDYDTQPFESQLKIDDFTILSKKSFIELTKEDITKYFKVYNPFLFKNINDNSAWITPTDFNLTYDYTKQTVTIDWKINNFEYDATYSKFTDFKIYKEDLIKQLTDEINNFDFGEYDFNNLDVDKISKQIKNNYNNQAKNGIYLELTEKSKNTKTQNWDISNSNDNSLFIQNTNKTDIKSKTFDIVYEVKIINGNDNAYNVDKFDISFNKTFDNNNLKSIEQIIDVNNFVNVNNINDKWTKEQITTLLSDVKNYDTFLQLFNINTGQIKNLYNIELNVSKYKQTLHNINGLTVEFKKDDKTTTSIDFLVNYNNLTTNNDILNNFINNKESLLSNQLNMFDIITTAGNYKTDGNYYFKQNNNTIVVAIDELEDQEGYSITFGLQDRTSLVLDKTITKTYPKVNNFPIENNSDKDDNLYMYLGIGAGILVVVLIILIVVIRKKSKTSLKSLAKKEIKEGL